MTPFKRYTISITAAALILALATAASAEVVDRVAAVVGDEVITLRELNRAYEEDKLGLMRQDPLLGETAGSVSRERYLDLMIEQKIIQQEVKTQGITIEALDVERAIDRRREKLGLSEEEFSRALAMEGISMDQYREQVREQLITFRLISKEVRGEIEVTDKEIEAYFRQHHEEFRQKPRLRLGHIFIPFPEDGGAAGRDRAVQRTESIRTSIENRQDFARAARKHSQSPTASQGGDLGWFTADELLPVFKKHAQDLGPGEMSPVFTYGEGAHLLMVLEKKAPEQKPLSDEVKDEIRDILYQREAMERRDLWIERLKAGTYVEKRLHEHENTTPPRQP